VSSTASARVTAAWQRVELKYVLPERAARDVLRFIEPFAASDPLGASAAGGRQRITSLYLDTPDADFYRRHVAYQADRFKLRVRRYGVGPAEAAFFEVKRKVGHVIDKRRARVPFAEARALLEGVWISDTSVAEQERPHLELFLGLMALHSATPKMLVTCSREAFCSREPSCRARVTVDREMACQNVATATLDGDRRRWAATPLERGSVILELKYSGFAPWWMQELARRLSGARAGHSKYVAAMALATGEGDGWAKRLEVPA
jgi:hypothetical protein